MTSRSGSRGNQRSRRGLCVSVCCRGVFLQAHCRGWPGGQLVRVLQLLLQVAAAALVEVGQHSLPTAYLLAGTFQISG